MNKPIIIGNWKLNGSKYSIQTFVRNFFKELSNFKKCNIIIAPPNIYLDFFKNILFNKNLISLCAQDVDFNNYGSFTGETSPLMLKDIGVKYVIIGHSERRFYHKEDDQVITKKFSSLKKIGLIPIICIGETKTEKLQDKTIDVICYKQLNSIIEKMGVESLNDSIIAYEPIWAIGTGKAANPNEVQIIHESIRQFIFKKNSQTAKKVKILYGGSINEKNAIKFFEKQDVDGLLVGNAALETKIFSRIINEISYYNKNNN
ncbi:triose-phosphate isomerase [Candidatus Tachikawaea gelatinosa]|uniref:Triosephosphate isomerase n=1 Tax=Candidatus Tachikawaea gelatinosa TaxID=1410383 RepID=A0A090AJL9_9ENTR|nr:triose-phosphate isomerase [Candidatus Tachikawaea gelatinosa]BAP58643.1 triosephosphate isomerase [Candidatus Tachikawaea gelatinosa]